TFFAELPPTLARAVTSRHGFAFRSIHILVLVRCKTVVIVIGFAACRSTRPLGLPGLPQIYENLFRIFRGDLIRGDRRGRGFNAGGSAPSSLYPRDVGKR